MFRLTRLTDYSIALLTHMVSDDKTIWASSDLATRTHLPQPTVSKILKLLAKSGLIKALRGAAGGYHLSRPAHEISIVQVVEAMDGPVSITDCSGVTPESECLIRDFCVMGSNWSKINHAVRHALASVTLADMAGRPSLPVKHSHHPDALDCVACPNRTSDQHSDHSAVGVDSENKDFWQAAS